MFLRNLLFISSGLLGIALVCGTLLEPPTFTEPVLYPTVASDPTFQEVVTSVNQEFHGEWKAKGLSPASRATDRQIARRLSLALTGTIPSLEEIRALDAHPADDRIQWWLSHLFEDDRYSDYIAERVARYTVGIDEGPFLVYRRRRYVDWLSEQIASNIRYDELARRLIMAEGTWTSDPETNFITVTLDQNEDKGPDEKTLATRLTRAFLGVRIDCMQCHDDFMGGDWKQEDFHRLAAFFSDADMTLTGIRDTPAAYEYEYSKRQGPEEVTPAVPFEKDLLVPKGRERQQLARWVTHTENRAFARTAVNRIWALMFGQPLVTPIDDIPLNGPFPPALETLADDFITHKYNLQRLIRVIAASDVYSLESRAQSDDVTPGTIDYTSWSAFPLTRLRPEQVAGSLLQASKLSTIDAESHIIVRLSRLAQQSDFMKRYGDIGEDEFDNTGGTIPQRLVLMNGKLVKERLEDNIVMNAAPRIAAIAPNAKSAITASYLAVLSREPTERELHYFSDLLEEDKGNARRQAIEDLYWILINSTEFSWNH